MQPIERPMQPEKIKELEKRLHNRPKGRGSWEYSWELLQGLHIDDLLEHPVIRDQLYAKTVPNMVHYHEEVNFMKKYISNIDAFRILEIGPAYGGFYKALLEDKMQPKEYVMVDGESMLDLIRQFLSPEEQEIVSLHSDSNIDKVSGKFDLMISNHCIHETSKKYQEFVFTKIVPMCDRFFGIVHNVRDDYMKLKDQYVTVSQEPGPKNPRLRGGTSCIFTKDLKKT